MSWAWRIARACRCGCRIDSARPTDSFSGESRKCAQAARAGSDAAQADAMVRQLDAEVAAARAGLEATRSWWRSRRACHVIEANAVILRPSPTALGESDLPTPNGG